MNIKKLSKTLKDINLDRFCDLLSGLPKIYRRIKRHQSQFSVGFLLAFLQGMKHCSHEMNLLTAFHFSLWLSFFLPIQLTCKTS